MPKINQTTLVSLPIPLPPLAEQHRIVAKVDALMALCDRLEASLTATASTRRRLLDALLAEVLAPAEEGELESAELGRTGSHPRWQVRFFVDDPLRPDVV